MYYIIFILILLLLAILTTKQKKISRWSDYYKNKLTYPVSDIVIKALQLIDIQKPKKPLIAIDFGCGGGNETAFLLKNNCSVLAIDNQPSAFEILLARQDIRHIHSRLSTLESSFETIHWEALEPVDLFVACFSLPFCHPASFDTTWNNIKRCILPNGLFIGHFFDPFGNNLTESKKKEMTLLKQDQVIKLFNDFNIIHFSSKRKKSPIYSSQLTVKYYEVIAKKQ